MTNDKVKVLFVPGHQVRDKNVDFALGGHHYVYDFIPEDEIWIEDGLKNKDDVNEIIAHEKIERTLMKSLGFGYEEAHEVASKIEENLRKKGTEMKKTASQIADAVLEKQALSMEKIRGALQQAIRGIKKQTPGIDRQALGEKLQGRAPKATDLFQRYVNNLMLRDASPMPPWITDRQGSGVVRDMF